MKHKTIVLGCLLAVFLLLIIPNVNAVEYDMHQKQIQQDENISPRSLLKSVEGTGFLWDVFKIIFAIIFGGYLGVAFSDLYFSRAVYVDDDANDDWYDFYHVKTIQEGINHANLGFANTVRVYNGTYNGQIMMSSTQLNLGNMGHWLIGNGSDSTIIDAKDCDFGISFSKISGWGRIIGFNIRNANGAGIDLGSSQWNFIYENTLLNNSIGIKNEGGKYSPIWKNNFISNEINAFDTGENKWSYDEWEEIPRTGNYWSDYTGEDSDGDGIGDSVYHIDGGNSVDNYPLIKQWEEER